MSVLIECSACKAMNPHLGKDQRLELARITVFLDPSPARAKESIVTIKCMRHGKVLMQFAVPMICPIDPTIRKLI